MSWRSLTPLFIAALFTAAKGGNTRVSLTEEQINKMWSVHTMEYYSVLKRKEILAHATRWVGLENIIRSKRSQPQKIIQSRRFHLN